MLDLIDDMEIYGNYIQRRQNYYDILKISYHNSIDTPFHTDTKKNGLQHKLQTRIEKYYDDLVVGYRPDKEVRREKINLNLTNKPK